MKKLLVSILPGACAFPSALPSTWAISSYTAEAVEQHQQKRVMRFLTGFDRLPPDGAMIKSTFHLEKSRRKINPPYSG